MTTSGCSDFCTAAECAELRQLINELQFQINATHALVQDHIFKNIPDAHQFNPEITVQTSLDANQLTTEVAINGVSGSDLVEFPDSVIPSVTMDIFEQDTGEYVFKVGVNGIFDEDTLTIEQPELGFAITPLSPKEYDFEITLGDQLKTQTLTVTLLDDIQPTDLNLDFAVDVSYFFNLLKVAVTVDGVTHSDTVYIDADVINNFGGGGSNNNNGGDDVGCEGISEAMDLNLAEILAAIAEVSTKVSLVQEYVTIDIEGKAITDFACPEEDEDGNTPTKLGKEEDYEGKGIAGIWELLKISLKNQEKIFRANCEESGVLAFPAWWQVRLGANVPQVVCSFRKAGSSTYHYLAIPHPKNTEKPTKPLLPAYTKGNWQGMVTLRDNSKFIINCETQAEAERMCNVAVGLIDGDYLELPPRIYVGERKGQGVSVDSMTPATISYFESGQQNFVPNWRVLVSKLESS